MSSRKWIVQHEMDDEPTFVCPVGDDGDYVTIGVDVPMNVRLKLAEQIAEILNREEK